MRRSSWEIARRGGVRVLLVLAPVTITHPGFAGTDAAELAALEAGRSGDAALFVPFLTAEPPTIRSRAALALGRITPPGAVPLLAPLLDDSTATVRVSAAFALGQMADTTAVEPLVRATGSGDIDLADEAAVALGKIGGPRAARQLATLLADGAPRIRGAAALGLARMADSTMSTVVLERLSVEEDPGVVWKLLRALEGAPRAAEPAAGVVAHLEARSPQVRATAARVLGRLGDRHAVRPLMRALIDPEWRVRVQASRALGALEDTAAIEALRSLLADPIHHVREAAAVALGEIGAEGMAGALAGIARDDPSIGVRRAATTALARIDDGNPEILHSLLTDPAPPVVAAALEGLGTLARSDVFDTLIAHTRSRHPAPVRMAACLALGELGEVAALATLVELLGDEDWVIAAVAAEALGRLGDDAAQSSLRAAYAQRTSFEGFDVRLAVVEALGRVGDRQSRPLLLEATRDRDPRLRGLAIAALDSVASRAGPDSARAWATRDSLAATTAPPAPGGARTGALPAGFPPAEPPVNRRARLITARGTVEIELFPEMAPGTVASFVRLTRSGFHDQAIFHRVVPDFVAQGGCPRHDGWGGPGYSLRSEWNPLRYGVGTVGMAHAGRDTGGSQFFITHSPQPHLDGRYTVFGRVVAGMSVVDALQQGDTFSVRLVEER